MDNYLLQETYQETILYAATKHTATGQMISGTHLPYVVHLCNVAMEIYTAHQHHPLPELNFALQVALLHDILEDTNTTFDELDAIFGTRVADTVLALTKNKNLPELERMPDSLNRIKQNGETAACVKLADRITNLQKPPAHWHTSKIIEYRNEAIIIATLLQGANTYLENRLNYCIEQYAKWIIQD